MEGEREERQLAHGGARRVLGPVPQEMHEGREEGLEEAVGAEVGIPVGALLLLAVVDAARAAQAARGGLHEEDGGAAEPHHGDMQQPHLEAEREEDGGQAGAGRGVMRGPRCLKGLLLPALVEAGGENQHWHLSLDFGHRHELEFIYGDRRRERSYSSALLSLPKVADANILQRTCKGRFEDADLVLQFFIRHMLWGRDLTTFPCRISQTHLVKEDEPKYTEFGFFGSVAFVKLSGVIATISLLSMCK